MSLEAAIDIGTNTMLLLAAEMDETQPNGFRPIKKVLADHLTFVRLGQGVHANRVFHPEAMDRALKCFHEYRKICDANGVKKIHAIATSASRDAKNSSEFYAKVKAETGISVQIIEGETEARLSFLGGLLPNQDPKDAAVMDIGGGSTEFVVLSKDGKSAYGESIDMGSVRATEIFLKGDPYTKQSLQALEDGLKKEWKTISPALQQELKTKKWVGIAGTATTLAALALGLKEWNSAKVDAYKLDRCSVSDVYEALAIQRTEERARNPIMGPGRADVMVAGVAILLTAMEVFDQDEVTVSSRGLRHGVLTWPRLVAN